MLEAAMDAMVKAISEDVTRCNRQINAAAPIHALPAEILAEILRLDIAGWLPGEDPNVKHTDRQYQLSSVCTFWREVVQSTPACWANIRLGRDPVRRALRKSGEYPLDISAIRSSDTSSSDYLLAVEVFMETIVPHSHRWRSLHLTCQCTPLTRQWLQVPTPRLQELLLVGRPVNANPADVYTLSEGPSLTHLTLCAAYLKWDCPRLTGLVSLNLQRLRNSVPTLHDLRNILSSSPKLASIEFCWWTTPPNPDQTLASPTTPIRFLFLNTLILQAIPEFIQAFLLSTIASASLVEFILPDLRERDLIPPNQDLPHPLFDLLAPALQDDQPLNVSMVVRTGQIVLRQDDNQARFRTSRPLESLKDMAKFITALQTSAPLRITVPEEWLAPFGTTLPAITFPLELLELPNVVHIRVIQREDAVQILAKLAQRQVDEGGESSWLCPKLETVDLKDVEGLPQDVVDRFRERRFGVVAQNVEGLVHYPMPLRNLELPVGLA